MVDDKNTCEVCGLPGEPSWGGSVLCETCYGTLGATCAGRPRRKTDKALPPDTVSPGPEAGVC